MHYGIARRQENGFQPNRDLENALEISFGNKRQIPSTAFSTEYLRRLNSKVNNNNNNIEIIFFNAASDAAAFLHQFPFDIERRSTVGNQQRCAMHYLSKENKEKYITHHG